MLNDISCPLPIFVCLLETPGKVIKVYEKDKIKEKKKKRREK